MGLCALLRHLFPSLPPLGLLRLSIDADACAVSHGEQLELLRARGDAVVFRRSWPVNPDESNAFDVSASSVW